MKLYIVWYLQRDFNVVVTIVNASSEEALKIICRKSNYIQGLYEYKEITLENFPDQETVIN